MRNLNDPDFRRSFAERQRLPPDAIPTHLPALNALMGGDGSQVGLGRGWYVTLAGLSGSGKSITAINFVVAALQAGESVAYCSLEMSAEAIASRYYAVASAVPVRDLERGNFSEGVWKMAAKGVEGLPGLWMPSEISSNWTDLVDFIRAAVEEKGVGLVVLDYLQLCSLSNSGDESAVFKAIAEITSDLQAYSSNVGVTSLVLSQFNRQTSSEFRVRPRMSGLWGSAMIEQASDCVLLLSHHAYERDDNAGVARTWIQLEKNRWGKVGDVPILNSYRDLSQRCAMPDEIDEWPKP